MVICVNAQNPRSVERMIQQRDSLEYEIKLEKLRLSLKELNSVSVSFVDGKATDIEEIIKILDRLCAERLHYKISNYGQSGNQGSTTDGGDQSSYSGAGNGTAGGNYQLGTRSALERPKPRYDCDGEGIVVVKVYVDRNGVVKRADGQGQKGSTANASDCLIRRSEEAALKTKWQADPNALELQVGTIRYNFQRI